ncbi:MAG TPA: hypothetical protein VNT75_16950 [Symbiobacteriaceae bacterium]|nr:hypothetical protein [Symbiobacteriaceae bacterium]
MKSPIIFTGLEVSLGIALVEETLSRWLGLPPSTWKHKLAIAAAAVAALVVWHGYRFGWDRLLDPTLAGESLFTALLGWGIWSAADWLFFHLPYTPAGYQPKDTPRL